MLAGRRRRQMFPSNAPARRAAQAQCLCHACVRSRVKERGGGPRADRRGTARQDGGQREEEEGEHLGPVQVHRQDDQGEVSGRPRSGILKGFDPLLNLVLDGTIEYMRDPDDQYKLTEDTRQLGLVVCRGTSVVLICPQDGMEAIPNPFIQQQEA
ncbi:U6 snRNA-associated Sm-like protein LSm7 isoform X1 [Phyllostomus discolor]|uniref:U6 snRNA-associated Sm-like protein LSm7 isoform X1 n=1 Tax=Phyllostomus discolor TaxID=89673 RepID=A0A7E6EAU9_9CHIR|nr:U6 snRNA-associated Sm-like protein LSm7 isoform X1 [Phyllostomus discolor]